MYYLPIHLFIYQSTYVSIKVLCSSKEEENTPDQVWHTKIAPKKLPHGEAG
jgi:hypothetical protein